MKSKVLTLKEIAELTQAEIKGDPNYSITGVADLESATAADASFFSNPKYEKAMFSSSAGVIFVSSSAQLPPGRNFLIVQDPSWAFQTLLSHFHDKSSFETGFKGIHSTAVIHPSAKLGKDVQIAPYVVIDQNVEIGDRSSIGPGTSVGSGSTIGNDCQIFAHVTIREKCHIGHRVIIQPGAVIGSCGFGYITDKNGIHQKLEQVGNVTIEDDVEIGANTTIDRARFKSTCIGRGTKTDNLVQIGHSVEIGPYNLIVSQVGIAGSSSTGHHVVLGGQVGVAGHLHIGDLAMVAAQSGVSKSLPEGQKFGGTPAVPLREYNRNAVFLRNIERYIEKIDTLQKQVETLEEPKT